MEIDVKCDYEILPDNNLAFKVKVTNNTDLVISNVHVTIDHTESFFELQGESSQRLGLIPPAITRTSEFILKPLGCIHMDNIEANLTYRDHRWEKHTITVRSEEVHCIYPFLRPRPMARNEFLEYFKAWDPIETGINFEDIGVEKITSSLIQMSRNRFHIVDGSKTEQGNVIYFSAESTDKEVCYLLKALVREEHGQTQVMFRAASDRTNETQEFLNEIVPELRKFVSNVNSAKDTGTIKKEHVISIGNPVVHETDNRAGSRNRQISRRNSVPPGTRAGTRQSVGSGSMNHRSGSEEEEDVARMYDAYLREVKGKTIDIEKKEAVVLPSNTQRTGDEDRKIRKFRGMTSPSRKRTKETKPVRNKKKLVINAMVSLIVLTLLMGFAVNNPFIMESLGGSIPAGPVPAESVTIDFLNAVNNSDFHTAFSMCQGKDFLAVASVQMIFTNRGIEGGSIRQIEVLSKDVADDIAVVDVECTVAILDSYGKEEDIEVMPIFFLLQDSEQGWAITQISFTEPFVTRAEE
ncbi:hypothetical protein [Methanolobus sp. WCC4]|uniref:hypothetical protein n=1 Tax=Methanolobus sp. WCC4 TaxID=3125784 RepID=UPI0030F6C1DA